MKQEVLGYKAPPQPEQYDQNCPFYGTISVKKELLEGTVIKKDTNRSATIEWDRSLPVPKYERFEVRRSRLRVHNPTSINAQVGDRVVVARTRPISKTKNHVVLAVVGKDKAFLMKEEAAREEAQTEKTHHSKKDHKEKAGHTEKKDIKEDKEDHKSHDDHKGHKESKHHKPKAHEESEE
ncbi:30S ribosomal protein S17 [Candidatus Woesearchaeota archaeon CG10_big_fil_rev_8_21_14_0_10_45_16]|nr:MAG: 30S ribosomal protein S17 [Candidatus Woesearchaeota archaeon CG10_big_fil_rev_8_21_14_0_10_45_16]